MCFRVKRLEIKITLLTTVLLMKSYIFMKHNLRFGLDKPELDEDKSAKSLDGLFRFVKRDKG